jgi:pimeloyl-ACP methyl ester carboxylesterase
MRNSNTEEPADFIIPVNMNKLQGRILRYIKPKQPKKEILLVYGHHTSIERCWELVRAFGRYGAVTVPDFPGYGGMENLYKIYENPSIDNLADYLAAVFKLRYKQRRVIIVAIGFGFAITTRMLQKYPDIAKKIDLCVGINAFSHKDDIIISKSRLYWYKFATSLLRFRTTSALFRLIWVRSILPGKDNETILRSIHNFSFRGDSFFEPSNVDYKLWVSNDMRTHAQTIKTMLSIDNCQDNVNLPVWNISFGDQTFLNENYVEQHLKVIFSEYHKLTTKFDLSLPFGSPNSHIGKIIPPSLRKKILELNSD